MFFETIYRLLISMFGNDMADYLSGYVCESGEYTGSNQFVMYGWAALGIALFVTVIYYYGINHPRFNGLLSWLLMLILVGVGNFLFGALMTRSNLNAGDIGDCLISGGNGGIETLNCWMFGAANAMMSIVFFIIWSIALKWWSRNCKYTPF